MNLNEIDQTKMLNHTI
jgi:hypothetical protein